MGKAKLLVLVRKMEREEGKNPLEQTLLRIVAAANAEGITEFLLIGGNAVVAHGVPRFTRDIDLAIPEREGQRWRSFLSRQEYSFIHGTDAFQQFDGGDDSTPRLDLMIVDEATWKKLVDGAWSLELEEGTATKIASPQHLIAMKLKACQSPHRRSDATDWGDIVQLCRVHSFDPENDGQFADFVLQFGGNDLLTQLINELAESRNKS